MAKTSIDLPRPLPNQITWSGWVVPNGGIDESKSDHELEPNKWAASFDVEPLPAGCRARNGYTAVNASAISGTPAITGILDYRTSDGVEERLLLVAGTEVYKEVAGTITSVSGGAVFTANADNHPAMTVGNDTAFISNGVETPKKFFIRSATEYFAGDGIAPPTASPTPGIAAGGSIPDGQYFIDYYYWDEVLQIKSNTRYQGIDTISATTAGGSNKITLTGLPAAVARSGDHATHILISLRPVASGFYRTGTTAEYKITLGTTTATLTTLALGDEPAYDDTVAPIHTIAAVGSNQRFIAGISGFPFRVMASKLGIVAPFYESLPSLNYRDLGRGDGDYVTALAFIPPATLVVGMRNSIWAIDARNFLTSDPILISKNVGIAGKYSWMVAGRSLFFVSDSDRTKGLMVWDGAQVHVLSGLDSTLKTFVMNRLRYATCANLAPGDDRFQWWILLTASGSSQNRVIVFDYQLNAFALYRISGNVIASAAKAGDNAKVKLGGTAGVLFNADTGTTDNGTAIQATFTANREDFGAPDQPKRVRFVRAEADGFAVSTVNVRYHPDSQGFPSFSGSINFSVDSGSVLGTGKLGSFILGTEDPIISARIGLVGVCRNLQPEFYGTAPWSLRGYSQGVQLLRRRA